MTTIEERSYRQYPVHSDFIVEEHRRLGRAGYIKGATEQDRIARAEERERCIEVAQDAHCKICQDNHDGRTCKYQELCSELKELRKAIEEGDKE